VTRVLFVVFAAGRWTLREGEVHQSGFWGEELALPHKIFSRAGWEITIATPGGNSFGRKAVWLLEDRLRESGATYSKARLPLLPYVVVDRNLYTGQNPPSSERLAERLVADMEAASNTG